MYKNIFLVYFVFLFYSCELLNNEQDFNFDVSLEGTTKKKLMGTSSTYNGAYFDGTPFFDVGLTNGSYPDIYLNIHFYPILPSPGIYSFDNPVDSISFSSAFRDRINLESVFIDSGEVIIHERTDRFFHGEISASGFIYTENDSATKRASISGTFSFSFE